MVKNRMDRARELEALESVYTSYTERLKSTVTFAEGACEARSRREEEDDAWPSSTTTNAEIVHNPHLPSGWRRDGPMALSLLLYDTRHRLVVASRPRPVARATNVTVDLRRSV